MSQLLAHLIGDYVLQNHWMANTKTKNPWAALIHVLLYGIPFLFLVSNWQQWAIIVITHYFIDRYRLAQHWVDFWGTGKAGWLPTRLERWWNKWPATLTSESFDGVSPGDVLDIGGNKHIIGAVDSSTQLSLSALPLPAPPFLAVWLLIIVDNTMHLAINFAVLGLS